MTANKLTLLKELDTDYYRIIETFPTSDGWRSRVCDYREISKATAEAEVKRRENIIEEYFGD